MRAIALFLSLILFISTVFAHTPTSITIGIVVPMEHTALHEIVEGFKESVVSGFPGNVTFKIKNAQGDLNVQRSILAQFAHQALDMVVPIGTTTTQMAVSIVKHQPIVSLAALYSEHSRKTNPNGNITGVHDEIPPKTHLRFIKQLDPNLKKITLIHSHGEKIIPQVQEILEESHKQGIEVQPLMIQSLAELYGMARCIRKDTQALFVLKDHLVVSGIQTLVKLAQDTNLLLIACDEGSVKNGAGVALGVVEKNIGIQGGQLALRVLSGQNTADLPMEEMMDLTVFVNTSLSLKTQETLKLLAKQNTYRFQEIAS